MKIYTDGCCLGNPGRGGYCTLIVDGDQIIDKISGGDKYTTNNRMELTALLEGFQYLEKYQDRFLNENNTETIQVISDSEYVINPLRNGWIFGWKNKGWRNSAGNVKNSDLWIRIYPLFCKYRKKLSFEWVRGHTGNYFNELCDQFSKEEAEKF